MQAAKREVEKGEYGDAAAFYDKGGEEKLERGCLLKFAEKVEAEGNVNFAEFLYEKAGLTKDEIDRRLALGYWARRGAETAGDILERLGESELAELRRFIISWQPVCEG